MNRKSELNK